MKFFLIVLTILFNLNGYAAQLGKITVKSTQDSLFDAEIILTLDKEDDIKKMIPSIASREIYSLQGMQRQKIHSDIKINLSKVEPNKALIFLKSSVPAKESFIDLLVQIESPKGKILKEYTVLLDPPLPKSKDLPKSQIVKKDNTNKKETEKKIQVRNTKILITKAGKTLFQIARENGIPGITTEQYAVAIFQLNPEAFAKKNINGLNKGKKIKLPTKKYFTKLSHLKARKILKEQNVKWNKKAVNKPTKKIVTQQKVSDKNNQNEIKRLKIELSKLKDELKKQKSLTEQIKSTQKAEISVKKQIKEKVSLDDSTNTNKSNEISVKSNKNQNESDDKNEDKDFISSIAIETETVIEEVMIDDVNTNESQSRSGLIYLLLALFSILGGLLVYLSKKRAKLNTTIDSVLPRTSVDEYIYRKKIEQEFRIK